MPKAGWTPGLSLRGVLVPSIHLSAPKGAAAEPGPSLGTGKSASIWLHYHPKLAAALSPFNISRCSGGSGEAPGGGEGCARTASVPLKRVLSYFYLFILNHFCPCGGSSLLKQKLADGWPGGAGTPSSGCGEYFSPLEGISFPSSLRISGSSSQGWRRYRGGSDQPPDFFAVLPPTVALPCHMGFPKDAEVGREFIFLPHQEALI